MLARQRSHHPFLLREINMRYVEVRWDKKPFEELKNGRYTFNDLEDAFDAVYPHVTKLYHEGRKLSLKRISFVIVGRWETILSYFLVKDLAFDLRWVHKHSRKPKEIKELTTV